MLQRGEPLTMQKLLPWVLVMVFSLLFLDAAWVEEDAFITFRVVDNVLSGFGPNWNPMERVQVYTHPLWLLLLVPLVALFHDPYFVSLGLSYACSLAALMIVAVGIGRRTWMGVAAIAALFCSRAFIDYSSSGLENPLVHLLLAAFVLVWVNQPQHPRRTFLLYLLASLLFLARPDAFLPVLPALLLELLHARQGFRKRVGQAILGATPAIAWLCFSLFYYGSPSPNTAIAKVATGLSLSWRAEQGWEYLLWSARHDPATLALIGAGCFVGLFRRSPAMVVLSLGLVGWMFYLLCIGGDYMGGRFLTSSALLSCAILAVEAPHVSKIRLAAVAVVVAVKGFTLLQPAAPTTAQVDYIGQSGITNEREFYWEYLSLEQVIKKGTWRRHPSLEQGTYLRRYPGIYTRCAVGMGPYAAGPMVYWIDPLALTDPFLARLPSRSTVRIGHFERAMPPGYLDSMVSGRNQVADPLLHDLFDDVELATRAPLLSSGRFGAIVRLNTGFYRITPNHFDRDAIGLPGVQVESTSKFSCYGLPYGQVGIYRLEGEPAEALRLAFAVSEPVE